MRSSAFLEFALVIAASVQHSHHAIHAYHGHGPPSRTEVNLASPETAVESDPHDRETFSALNPPRTRHVL